MQEKKVWTLVALAMLTALTLVRPEPRWMGARRRDRRRMPLFQVAPPPPPLMLVRPGLSSEPTGAAFFGVCIKR